MDHLSPFAWGLLRSSKISFQLLCAYHGVCKYATFVRTLPGRNPKVFLFLCIMMALHHLEERVALERNRRRSPMSPCHTFPVPWYCWA